MNCIYCDYPMTRVLNSAKDGRRVLRERACMSCRKMFWTEEKSSTLYRQLDIRKELHRLRGKKKEAQDADS